jgi:hypothetical protein
MESNTNSPDFSGAEEPLDEPHFDEEATLMSARPVVPLHKVQDQERSGRRLVFGLLLVAALVVGALGATLVYMQRAENRSTAVVETSSPVADPDAQVEPRGNDAANAASSSDVGEAAAGSQESEPLVAEHTEDQVKRDESENDDTSIVPNRPLPSISEKPEIVASQRNDDDDDGGNQEKEMRRAERKEARRLKRLEEREAKEAEKREKRADKGRSENDLLRIREIFEGSPRP